MDFYIIKHDKSEPFYNNTNDIGYVSLDQAREAIDILSVDNQLKPHNYYILRININNTQEAVSCLFAAGNTQYARITQYHIVELIKICHTN